MKKEFYLSMMFIGFFSYSTFSQSVITKYLEFAQSKMNYLPDDRIRKRLKMKFPEIMPVDVERVIKKVQTLRANRS